MGQPKKRRVEFKFDERSLAPAEKMAAIDTATDLRTGERLFHECGTHGKSPVAIAGWGSDLERRYECQVCFKILRRGELTADKKP